MIEDSGDLVARIGQISANLGAVQAAMSSVLADIVCQAGPELAAGKLRDLGHGLIALAGELTSFGVELARQADERK